jgi:hypothetical protein
MRGNVVDPLLLGLPFAPPFAFSEMLREVLLLPHLVADIIVKAVEEMLVGHGNFLRVTAVRSMD